MSKVSKLKVTSLKDPEIVKVDLVNRGANQGAKIMLKKGRGESTMNLPKLPKFGLGWLIKKKKTEDVFNDNYLIAIAALHENIIDLYKSKEESKQDLIQKSLEEFSEMIDTLLFDESAIDTIYKSKTGLIEVTDGMKVLLKSYINKAKTMLDDSEDPKNKKPNPENPDGSEDEQTDEFMIDETQEEKDKLTKCDGNCESCKISKTCTKEIKKGVDEEMLDKSKMTPEDLAAYEKLEKAYPKVAVTKSSELEETVKKSQQQLEALIEKNLLVEQTAIAKKYEIIPDTDIKKLAQELVDLKKANPNTYLTTIAMLDKTVDAINKSGMFDEFGHTGSGVTNDKDEAWEKLEIKATELQKSNPTMPRPEAIEKACNQNPDLLNIYQGKGRTK
jgi:hypothetical protein